MSRKIASLILVPVCVYVLLVLLNQPFFSAPFQNIDSFPRLSLYGTFLNLALVVLVASIFVGIFTMLAYFFMRIARSAIPLFQRINHGLNPIRILKEFGITIKKEEAWVHGQLGTRTPLIMTRTGILNLPNNIHFSPKFFEYKAQIEENQLLSLFAKIVLFEKQGRGIDSQGTHYRVECLTYAENQYAILSCPPDYIDRTIEECQDWLNHKR